ncbi:hypothetical protein AtubIFM54640_008364 [Aspergillus tubingensis]|uniref:Uncharacterized protein n=1 Tax=Aspergillus tubingensis (strain CBS 134.48) TaxID=767770 RepID=A0A1L9NNP5_ASPTC|nr:hypothetical protein ASPTUDRAFT_111953 [Aspergillus tubingensis CBS 134.48]GLA66160.1 hypothetical protein AtubIFM54640_008364 [Aspergillus tubingensis]GLA92751.1 hypothetical protein AtubIFM57143_009106 [Aspergillus tubingensis]
MWLYRGVQSAVFYYATCTPCANTLDRHKRKKEAVRSQREKDRIDATVTDQPRPLAQPTAFSTNPGWAEEIALGPGPPARRGGHRNAHRRTDSWNTGISADSTQDVSRGGNSANKKDKSSLKHPLGDRWSRMRNQREDEPLWGQDVEVKGSSVGLSGRGKADAGSSSKYYIARVPPVNDLHPPIVSGPKSRAETRWMLQPPPSARVMAGKERSGDTVRNNDTSGQRVDGDRNVNKPVTPAQQLPPIATQPAEKKNVHKPSPLRMAPDGWYDPRAVEDDSEGDDEFSPPSSPRMMFGRDQANFVISPSFRSRSDSCSTLSSPGDTEVESPRVSLHQPGTPTSRPVSKATQDSGKHFPPTISQALSTLQRDNNKVQLLHLEINDSPDDIGLGHLERLRPWRWSMDI